MQKTTQKTKRTTAKKAENISTKTATKGKNTHKDLKYYLQKAVKEHFAIGALNFSNMESLQGIIEGAAAANSPIIIAVSEGALAYMGEDYCVALASVARKHSGVFLHLDHGKSFEICKKAVDLGFDSVMIDVSALPFAENVKLTKKVASYAHKKGVLTEGELGQIKGVEDRVNARESFFTNPREAKEFVEKTGVDLLAISIGTSHGAYKHSGNITLHFEILSEIEKLLPDFPLVLHGASSVNAKVVARIGKFGGDVKKAAGIPEKLLEKATKEHNIAKINSDTDLRMETTATIRELLHKNKAVIDPREYLSQSRENIKKLTIEKIETILHSDNKL